MELTLNELLSHGSNQAGCLLKPSGGRRGALRLFKVIVIRREGFRKRLNLCHPVGNSVSRLFKTTDMGGFLFNQ
ncbi:hypothetical protein ACXYUI_30085, partial [Klebsiella pneumoniae]